VEGLVSVDRLTFDEDPSSVTDQLSSDQGGVQILGTAFLVLAGARAGTGESGH
jgi:hypothetical protein